MVSIIVVVALMWGIFPPLSDLEADPELENGVSVLDAIVELNANSLIRSSQVRGVPMLKNCSSAGRSIIGCSLSLCVVLEKSILTFHF